MGCTRGILIDSVIEQAYAEYFAFNCFRLNHSNRPKIPILTQIIVATDRVIELLGNLINGIYNPKIPKYDKGKAK